MKRWRSPISVGKDVDRLSLETAVPVARQARSRLLVVNEHHSSGADVELGGAAETQAQ